MQQAEEDDHRHQLALKRKVAAQEVEIAAAKNQLLLHELGMSARGWLSCKPLIA